MNIEEVWKRIIANEGQLFHQIRGNPFSYIVVENSIVLSTTNRSISKDIFGQAIVFVPLKNRVPIQILPAPSYVYAILMDERIRGNMW